MRKEELLKLAERYESFYLYEEEGILKHIKELKKAFPDLEFLYSVKCNPHAGVLESVFKQDLGADAASLGEVKKAEACGLLPDQIFYSAPGKSDSDLKEGLLKANVIADSLNELFRMEKIAVERKTAFSVGVRINPDFVLGKGSGTASKFGIDEEVLLPFLKEKTFKGLKIIGIHVHVKSQELDAEALSDYYPKILKLAENVEKALGYLLSYINLGSGLGIPYAKTDKALDLTALGSLLGSVFREFKRTHPETRLLMESGRYVVGESGCYVTHVLDRKESRGKVFIILQNTLNAFIRPSLAMAFEKCGSEVPPAMEPLYTKPGAFALIPLGKGREQETVTLVGNLCTAADVIAQEICLPCLEVGDVLVITHAGAYAAALSPMQFASLERPKEIFLKSNGESIL